MVDNYIHVPSMGSKHIIGSLAILSVMCEHPGKSGHNVTQQPSKSDVLIPSRLPENNERIRWIMHKNEKRMSFA
jgi:hypothetical protein